MIDQPAENRSSRVAAGLFNPITGKKMVKTWLADTLFPYLHQHYRDAEAITGERFFYPMPVYRPFLSIEEQNEWMAKSAAPELQSYIEDIATRPLYPEVRDVYGGLILKQCGYLDTVAYIAAVRKLIEREAIFIEGTTPDKELIIDGGVVRFKEYEAARIIFCNGTHTNAWFGWLPIRPLKGEALRIQTSYPRELIINRGVYMVPATGSDIWRVGATHHFHDREPAVTEKARKELATKISELVSFPFIIVGQEWGLRPTTPDRRPLLGCHPELDQAFIFNGLGTKGVSLAPYFSEVLVRSIENGEPLHEEVNIERYKSLYWTAPK